jgi:hypothetical protein
MWLLACMLVLLIMYIMLRDEFTVVQLDDGYKFNIAHKRVFNVWSNDLVVYKSDHATVRLYQIYKRWVSDMYNIYDEPDWALTASSKYKLVAEFNRPGTYKLFVEPGRYVALKLKAM